MKGFVPIIFIVLAAIGILAVFMGTSYVLTQDQITIENSNGTLQNVTPTEQLTEDMTNAVWTFPYWDIVNYLWAGISGVIQFIVNKIIIPVLSYIMKFITHDPNVVVPSWFGYLILVLIFLTTLWKKWKFIMTWSLDKLIIIFVFAAIFFVVGMLLLYFGFI